MALTLSTSFLTSCLPNITRDEVDATIWLNNLPLPAELCEREPQLKKRGFYRRLDNGKLEFVSVCNPKAKDWISANKVDFNRILDKTLPKQSPPTPGY